MHTFSKALVASTLLSAASAVNVVNVQGQDFVDSVTGSRFEILGIDYQPGGSAGFQESSSGAGSDPLSNPTACLRDASLMQQLGINTGSCPSHVLIRRHLLIPVHSESLQHRSVIKRASVGSSFLT